jgi:hypothetical protein
MSADIQHMLRNLELTPPPEAWQAIEHFLDTEFNAEEIRVGQHVYDIAVVPPRNAWQTISQEIEPKRAVTIPFRKIAIAASVIGLTGLVTWFLFHNSPEGNKLIIPSASAATTQADLNKNDHTGNTAPVTASNNLPGRPVLQRSSGNVRRKNNNDIVTGAYNSDAYGDENDATSNIQYASLGNLAAVNTYSSPTITAPPIRDARGNIILDPEVLTPFNDCYVTVTGPNGEQTRISSKFLQVLNSLNPDRQPQEYFDMIIRNNSLWKQRFNDWRKKLSQQSAFIPDAANFFDIVSLRDLIEEDK